MQAPTHLYNRNIQRHECNNTCTALRYETCARGWALPALFDARPNGSQKHEAGNHTRAWEDTPRACRGLQIVDARMLLHTNANSCLAPQGASSIEELSASSHSTTVGRRNTKPHQCDAFPLSRPTTFESKTDTRDKLRHCRPRRSWKHPGTPRCQQ